MGRIKVFSPYSEFGALSYTQGTLNPFTNESHLVVECVRYAHMLVAGSEPAGNHFEEKSGGGGGGGGGGRAVLRVSIHDSVDYEHVISIIFIKYSSKFEILYMEKFNVIAIICRML